MTPQEVSDLIARRLPPIEPTPENAPAWLIDQLVRASRMPISRQVPRLKGVVIHITPGAVVWVQTESRDPDKRLLTIQGKYYFVDGLSRGDKVECQYRIHPSGLIGGWTCRKVE
jgi:hypothetical protein